MSEVGACAERSEEEPKSGMKLVIAVVHRRDARALHDCLLEAGYRFTEISSTGGFLGTGNVTFLLGVENSRVDDLLAIMRANCRSREETVNLVTPHTRIDPDALGAPMTVRVGGALVFVLDVVRVEHV